MIELNSRNVKLFAARNYTNTSCLGEDEFSRDFNLTNKIDTLLSKELESQAVRKLVNMVITYFNVFEHEAATQLLFYNTSQKVRLKTLLVFLNRFPDGFEYIYPSPIDISFLGQLYKEIK
jgi:hypothetical protein